MAASSVPSPLYVVYQQEWGFSATTLTFVFAIYVVGLLGSLLVVGALSDHVGGARCWQPRSASRPSRSSCSSSPATSTVLTLARVAQGIATGAAMTTLGAASST